MEPKNKRVAPSKENGQRAVGTGESSNGTEVVAGIAEPPTAGGPVDFKQKPRRTGGLAGRVKKYEARIALYGDYEEVKRRQIMAAAERRAAAFEYRSERYLDGLRSETMDNGEILELTTARKVEKLQKKLRMRYRARRESNNRRQAKLEKSKQPGYEENIRALDADLAALEAEHKARVEKFIAARRAALAALPPKNKTTEAEYESKAAAVKAADAEKRKRILSEAEAKAAAFKRYNDRRIGRFKAKYEGDNARLRQLLKDEGFSLPAGTVLSVRDLCMYFGGVKAVDGLSFDVKKGEIFGLIGPNGAGKTTVFNCITQFYKPTRGTLYFENKMGEAVDLNKEKVHNVILQGIVRTFQNVEVIREVSVLDNLLIAGHRQYTSNLFEQALHLPVLRIEEAVIRSRALHVLDFMGLTPYKDWYAMGLPYGVLKKIEIARTLMCDPQLIILDEPAAGLNDTETAELSALIKKIQDEYDCTVLLVEHDMGLVMDICDTVCAISFGKLLAIGTPAQIQANKEVQEAYLGVAEEKQ